MKVAGLVWASRASDRPAVTRRWSAEKEVRPAAGSKQINYPSSTVPPGEPGWVCRHVREVRSEWLQ